MTLYDRFGGGGDRGSRSTRASTGAWWLPHRPSMAPLAAVWASMRLGRVSVSIDCRLCPLLILLLAMFPGRAITLACCTGLLLGRGCSAALPSFSWDTVPVFWHAANASGLFGRPRPSRCVAAAARFCRVPHSRSRKALMVPISANERFRETASPGLQRGSSRPRALPCRSSPTLTLSSTGRTTVSQQTLQRIRRGRFATLAASPCSFPAIRLLLSRPRAWKFSISRKRLSGRGFALRCANLTASGALDGCFEDRAGKELPGASP